MSDADPSPAPLCRRAAEILISALRYQGCRVVFTLAGESFLDVLDAALDVDDLKIITCRQEGGLAFMVEAAGKLTGKPGVGFVTRGPGACNAAIGVHTAQQDSTPMVLFVGQSPRGNRHRDGFQEIDLQQLFGGMAKWVADIDDAARIPEMVARAFHVAAAGRPGPVVLGLPEDMLAETSDAPDSPPNPPARPYPDPALIAQLGEVLRGAQRPLVLAGGSGWTDEACADLRRFAEANRLPVCSTFRRQDVFDHESDCWVGDLGYSVNPKLAARLKGCDFLIVIGARLNDVATQGFTALDKPTPQQALAHIHPSGEELGRVFRPDLAIQADAAAAAAALAALEPVADPPWDEEWTRSARADWLEWLEPSRCVGAVDLGVIFGWLRERIPANAVVTVDAGNFAGWPQRHLLYRRPGRLLGAACGAMGYGLPAAVAAKLIEPRRPVFCFSGDGGFMMTAQELATAKLHGAAPIVFVINNGMYGTIRMHQERRHPGRVSGTDLANPDFAALAQAHGCFGAAVTRTEEFVPAFWDAMWSGLPSVIELRVDPAQISVSRTLDDLRAAVAEGGTV
jgi:acetolactate synthase I/II/III large subunit